MTGHPESRTHRLAAGVRLVLRTHPDEPQPSVTQDFAHARLLAVDANERVRLWDGRGRLLVSYPAGRVIGWWPLGPATPPERSPLR